MTENDIEQIALSILSDDLGYTVLYGPAISDGANKERDYTEVILKERLSSAINRINGAIPADAKEEAFKKVLRTFSSHLFDSNRAFHQMLTEGIDVKFSVGEGKARTDKVWLIDFENASNNDFVAANQFTVVENHVNKRPDIVVFVNGLPLVVVELKNATDSKADLKSAFNQLQTYKKLIPSLFNTNAFMVVTDGWFAKAGTLSSDFSRFMEWKTSDGITIIDTKRQPEMEAMLLGLFNKSTLLDVLRHFIVFEKTKDKTIKKIAAYHQYYAVNRAIEKTVEATTSNDERTKGKAGVVWHTQGSGKSLSMVFYAGKLVLSEKMNNPTIVILTDRNDLDQQLFETFGSCEQLLRQKPKQAENRDDLKEKLSVASGGVVFTTIQKFMPSEMGESYPLLSDRRNIVVVADEAHRSQYDFVDGFARNIRDALPNASFIGFTGTPIETEDKNTEAVFGSYIHIYDIQQAVEDGATVKIYYESRLAKIELSEENRKIIDEKIEGISENDELTEKQKQFAKWTSKEAVVGSSQRLQQIANDLVNHFEGRVSSAEGKGMIVSMSRRICVALHDEIIKLRPNWYDKDDEKGVIKVIMTGSASDPLEWQEHVRNKPRRKAIGDRLKDSANPLKLVIVRDMWLTGFDAPCLHTLYIDKPMNGHNLMQAIARVNRVYGDKQGGLIVDYIGIAQDLKNALAIYTKSDGRGEIVHDLVGEAVPKMLEFYDLILDLLNGYDFKKYFEIETKHKLGFLIDTANYIADLKENTSGESKRNGKERFNQLVTKLSQAFGLAGTSAQAKAIRDDLALFQAIRSRFAKFDEQTRTISYDEIETSIRQILNDAIISHEVIDVFEAAGIKKPNIEILDDEFLNTIKNLPRKNLAFELLKKLLNDEIKLRSKTNLIQSKKFSEMLALSVKRYQSGLVEAAQVIDELVGLARNIKEADKRGERLNLRQDEIAFYDALTENPLAERLMGDETLRAITHDLVESVRNNTSIDWQLKESVQAKLRVLVKRILRKYKYPPDDPETGEYTTSVNKVLDQAESLAEYWVNTKE